MTTYMTPLISRSRIFALEGHGDQKYAEFPYWKHLFDVVVVLLHFGIEDEDVLAAAWSHDVVEDTPKTLDELREATSTEVARLVDAVTDCPGATRKERKLATYQKLLIAGPKAIRVKVADRIANTEFSFEAQSRQFAMYMKEYPLFRETLRDPTDLITLPMWDHLDQISKWVKL